MAGFFVSLSTEDAIRECPKERGGADRRRTWTTTGGDWAVAQRKGREQPELIYRDGEPVAVILDIRRYEEMLECLEDLEDLQMLRQMRERPLRFRTLAEFLEEHSPSA